MATLLELAKLSNAVYDLSQEVAGWTCTPLKCRGGQPGFQAAEYRRDGDVVIAFRGTSKIVSSDGVADLKLFAGMNTTYFAQGDAFAEPYQGKSNVIVTGHSLGGAIAQVVANRGGFVMATFNAPGVGVIASRNIAKSTPWMNAIRVRGMALSTVRHPIQAARDVQYAFRPVRGVNLCLSKDPISIVGNHYGKVLRIEGGTLTNAHSMETVISVLEMPRYAAIANRQPHTF